MKQIAVYISNLSYRTDRRRSICKQFYHKQLFKIHFVPAIQHKTGAFGLWKTFLSIVAKERQNDSPYFVFCEDDHVFTEAYTDDFIMRRIEEADSLKADILQRKPGAEVKGLHRRTDSRGTAPEKLKENEIDTPTTLQ